MGATMDIEWAYSTTYVAIAFFRVMLAAAIVFWLVPMFLFDRNEEWGMVDVFFANMMKMVALTIIVVYVLVVFKLY